MEIGGYLELEKNRGSLYHENAWRLNSGRSCLEWIIEEKGILNIAIPYFMCNVVTEVCERHGLNVLRYGIESDLQPSTELDGILRDENEGAGNLSYWLYLVNYYGQLKTDTVEKYKVFVKKGLIAGIIVDDTQAYFEDPISGTYTLYSCRKYLGVPDGAFLYAPDLRNYEAHEYDKSADHAHHLLGRFEGIASDYYKEFKDDDERLRWTGIKRMSKLTANMLRGIDYEFVKKRRTENYTYLEERLENRNKLTLSPIEGAFSYPLWVENGRELREKLIGDKIYVPILWPNVLGEVEESTIEYDLASNILPLPCDQRYDTDAMKRICEVIGL